MEKKSIPLYNESKLNTIPLLSEEAKVWKKDAKGNKKLVVNKDAAGQISYTRNDAIALENMLARFSTAKYQVRDWKQVMTIRKKLRECYLTETTDLKLTASEIAFLKSYIDNLPEKEGKVQPLRNYEMITYFYLKDILAEY